MKRCASAKPAIISTWRSLALVLARTTNENDVGLLSRFLARCRFLRQPSFMRKEAHSDDWSGLTRRRFVGLTLAGGAAVLAGTSSVLRAATTTSAEGNSMFNIGGDLSVNRLGFGAMRITGDGIWGWPKDR